MLVGVVVLDLTCDISGAFLDLQRRRVRSLCLPDLRLRADRVAEAIIRKTCKELDIEVIDMAVNSYYVHLFIKYPPKYSVSFIAKRIKERRSRILRQEFPELKKWCKRSIWAPNCYHRSVGHGREVVENYIGGQDRKSRG